MQISLYYLPLVVLFGLAVSDLIVGVANDAVNFTNSAIGSRVAPRRMIMLVASIGIVIGTIYSAGMLEIARKGVMHPQYYTFDHVIIIFLAVMFSDVILLDLFNTYGLPTSTSVSFVFELIGGAVAVGMIVLLNSGSDLSRLALYINSDRALLMIFGIFISVLLAFISGLIIQFITRLFLTFRVKKHHRINVSLWSAFAISFIVYYILIKGLKHSVLISPQIQSWLSGHAVLFLILLFVICSVIFLLFSFMTAINPLKIVVLAGTFALALAFAANDLVNFIGVPLAGLLSYQVTGFDPQAGSRMMDALNEPAQVPMYIILSAAVVMTITLWLSKKAKHVTSTEVALARQSKGKERFEASRITAALVNTGYAAFMILKTAIPSFIQTWIKLRYRPKKYIEAKKGDRPPAFDLVRASVNLMVASSLISLGTSLKLPLSTTYVTFMVAMGSSIADGAWKPGNAAARLNGVLIVISGWLLTGLIAFIAAFVIALFLHFAGTVAIFVMMLLTFFSVTRTHLLFRAHHHTEM